jgi:hypothetical protein
VREGKSSSINNNLAVDRLAHNPKVGGSNPPPPQPTEFVFDGNELGPVGVSPRQTPRRLRNVKSAEMQSMRFAPLAGTTTRYLLCGVFSCPISSSICKVLERIIEKLSSCGSVRISCALSRIALRACKIRLGKLALSNSRIAYLYSTCHSGAVGLPEGKRAVDIGHPRLEKSLAGGGRCVGTLAYTRPCAVCQR